MCQWHTIKAPTGAGAENAYSRTPNRAKPAKKGRGNSAASFPGGLAESPNHAESVSGEEREARGKSGANFPGGFAQIPNLAESVSEKEPRGEGKERSEFPRIFLAAVL